MVVKPGERHKLTVEEQGQIGRLSNGIDTALKAGMENMESYITFRPPEGTTRRVINHIKELYEGAGWVVAFESDQRDGDFFKFNYKK